MFNGAVQGFAGQFPQSLLGGGRFPTRGLPWNTTPGGLLVPRAFSEQFANNPQSTLVRDILADDSSFEVADGGTFSPLGKFATIIDGEIIGVGARSGNWLSTLVRGDESTSRAGHLAGAAVTQILTARSYAQGIADRVGAVGPVGLVFLGSYIASSGSPSLDVIFRNAVGRSGALFQTDFDSYKIEFLNFLGSADAGLRMRLSTNGGSSWLSSGVYERAQSYTSSGSTGGNTGALSETAWSIEDQLESTSAPSWQLSGTMELYNPLSGVVNVSAIAHTGGLHSDLQRYSFSSAFFLHSAALGLYNAFQVFWSSGTITSGTIRCYGISKS